MISPQHNELDQLLRRERLGAARNWCFGLGLVACTIAISLFGDASVGNPKTWTSTYHALADAGELRWLILPLFGIGLALLVAAAALTVLIRRR